MLQPKIYVKDKNKVYDTQVIDYKHKLVIFFDNETQCTHTRWFPEVEFMENTGLMDKNGKYIYEGDILEFYDEYPTWDCEYGLSACEGLNTAIVTKEKNCITLTNFQADGGRLEEMLCNRESIFDELNFEDYEVVDNIYENKELLKNE